MMFSLLTNFLTHQFPMMVVKELRSGPETQKEHREIAVECANAIEPVFPMIMDFICE